MALLHTNRWHFLCEYALLNGRKSTAAWMFTPQLARRYPMARLQADAIFLEDGAVLTTGAVSSSLDLAIQIIKRTLGAEVAMATARVALLSNQRASQAPFFDNTLMDRGLPPFSKQLQHWFSEQLTEEYNLNRLALVFHISPSTLLRRIKFKTGQSPLSMLQLARVEKAKHVLSNTTSSIARITAAVGYSDVSSFSRLFTRIVGETPFRYRRR
jgi:transcriptional regulator GlxA family with amidase domain